MDKQHTPQEIKQIVDGLNHYVYDGKVARQWGYVTKSGKLSNYQKIRMYKAVKDAGYVYDVDNSIWSLDSTDNKNNEVVTKIDKPGHSEMFKKYNQFLKDNGLKSLPDELEDKYTEFMNKIDQYKDKTIDKITTSYMLCIDESGSIDKEFSKKITNFVADFAYKLNIANPNALIGLTTFGSSRSKETVVRHNMQEVSKYLQCEQYIHTSPGMTAMNDGLILSANEINSVESGNKVIILFSDGGENNSKYSIKDARDSIKDITTVSITNYIGSGYWKKIGLKESNVVGYNNTDVEALFNRVIQATKIREDKVAKGEELTDEFFMDIA